MVNSDDIRMHFREIGREREKENCTQIQVNLGRGNALTFVVYGFCCRLNATSSEEMNCSIDLKMLFTHCNEDKRNYHPLSLFVMQLEQICFHLVQCSLPNIDFLSTVLSVKNYVGHCSSMRRSNRSDRSSQPLKN